MRWLIVYAVVAIPISALLLCCLVVASRADDADDTDSRGVWSRHEHP